MKVARASDKYLVILDSDLFNNRYINIPRHGMGLEIAKRKSERITDVMALLYRLWRGLESPVSLVADE